MIIELKNKRLEINEIDPDDIMDLCLLLEMNNGKNNPTDYSMLLSEKYCGLNLSYDDIEIIVTKFYELLSMNSSLAGTLVWGLGKLFDEAIIENALTIIISKYEIISDDLFKQIMFVVEIIHNTTIESLYSKIKEKYYSHKL